jgi:hypothetical protein
MLLSDSYLCLWGKMKKFWISLGFVVITFFASQSAAATETPTADLDNSSIELNQEAHDVPETQTEYWIHGTGAHIAVTASYLDGVKSFAVWRGVTVEEAVNGWKYEQDFWTNYEQISEQFDGSLVSFSWLSHNLDLFEIPSHPVSVTELIINRQPTATERAILSWMPFDTKLIVRADLMSFDDLQSHTNAVARALQERFPGGSYTVGPMVNSNSVSIDVKTSTFEAFLGSDTTGYGNVTALITAYLESRREDLQLDLTEFYVWEHSVDVFEPQISLIGGTKILVDGQTCTAGFVATNGAEVGIITAAHCVTSGTVKFPNISSVLQVSTAHESVPANYGDLIWVGFEDTDGAPAFQQNWSSVRNVTGIAPITGAGGYQYCMFGVVTGQTCSVSLPGEYISSYSQTLWNGQVATVTLSGLRAWAAALSKPGDSGGPLFAGSKAAGICQGIGIAGGISRTLFTSLSAMSQISAQLLLFGSTGPI